MIHEIILTSNTFALTFHLYGRVKANDTVGEGIDGVGGRGGGELLQLRSID